MNNINSNKKLLVEKKSQLQKEQQSLENEVKENERLLERWSGKLPLLEENLKETEAEIEQLLG